CAEMCSGSNATRVMVVHTNVVLIIGTNRRIAFIRLPSLRGTCRLPCGKAGGSDKHSDRVHLPARDSCAWCPVAYQWCVCAPGSYPLHLRDHSTCRAGGSGGSSWCH